MSDVQMRPTSTYRLQFSQRFGFAAARELLPYLADLGVTDCYSSPILRATPGSTHGYDICDHGDSIPSSGRSADFVAWCAALRDAGMGHIVDFVPNHMSCDPTTNPWWRDVLENGPSSPYARYFDIDWDPVKPELKGKVLLPLLGDQYGRVLERGELRLHFEAGALHLRYFERDLPINPRQSPRVLGLGIDRLDGASSGRPGAARVSQHPDGAAEPARLHRAGRRRESSSVSVKRKSLASVWRAWSATRRRSESTSMRPVTGRERHPRRPGELRSAARPARASGIPSRLLADGGRRDQLSPVLRHQRAGRSPDGGTGGVRGGPLAAPPADCVRADQRAPDRPSRRPVRSGRVFSARAADGACRRGRTAISRSMSSPKRFSRPASRCVPTGRVAGTTGYGFLNLVSGLFIDGRHARRLRRVYAQTDRSPGGIRGGGLPEQAHDHADRHGERAQRAGARAQSHLRTRSPSSRFHAEQLSRGAAGGDRLFPGVSHLHQRSRHRSGSTAPRFRRRSRRRAAAIR